MVDVHAETSGFVENLQIIDAFYKDAYEVDRSIGHFGIVQREQGYESWLPTMPCIDVENKNVLMVSHFKNIHFYRKNGLNLCKLKSP